MSRKALLIGMYFLFLSQVIDPNGTVWNYQCTAAEPFDTTGFATAFYNDPNQDCISNDFLIFFNYSDGSVEPFTPEDWEQSEPNSQGYYNFDSSFWSCCANPDDISGGANPETCPCDWHFDPNTLLLTVECPSGC